ncbi:hypothetical protein AX27061_2687 [Achromobacter xylosoxidans NBRC 15126 = ATCC 27061]|nr:hypothetical protein AX27061_2687 [Achromobacter xylosoxidans NBRC 15126 = ATCC 27061]
MSRWREGGAIRDSHHGSLRHSGSFITSSTISALALWSWTRNVTSLSPISKIAVASMFLPSGSSASVRRIGRLLYRYELLRVSDESSVA